MTGQVLIDTIVATMGGVRHEEAPVKGVLNDLGETGLVFRTSEQAGAEDEA